MEKISKKLVYLCAAITFFYSFSFCGFVSVYGYLPDYFNTDLVTFSYSGTIFGITGFLLAFATAFLYKKLGVKTCIVIAGFITTIFGLGFTFVPTVPVLYVVFGLVGFTSSLGTLVGNNAVLVRRYGQDAPKYMTVCVGANLLACGLTQTLTGILYSSFGMSIAYLVCSVGAGVIGTALAFFLPKDDKNTETTTAVETEALPRKKVSSWKNPRAWCFYVATAAISIISCTIINYVSVFLPEYGMSVRTATVCASMLGIGCGIYNLFISGFVMGKLGVKNNGYFNLICLIGMPLVLSLYSKFNSMIVVVIAIVLYAIGATSIQMHSIVSPAIFGEELSVEVTSKAVAFQGIASIVFPPVFASIAVAHGYKATFYIASIAVAISLALYIYIFSGQKKAA